MCASSSVIFFLKFTLNVDLIFFSKKKKIIIDAGEARFSNGSGSSNRSSLRRTVTSKQNSPLHIESDESYASDPLDKAFDVIGNQVNDHDTPEVVSVFFF